MSVVRTPTITAELDLESLAERLSEPAKVQFEQGWTPTPARGKVQRGDGHRRLADREAMDLRPYIVVVEDEATQRELLADYLAGQNFRVSAVDGSPEMLQAARRSAHGHQNVEIRQGNLEALQIDHEQLDIALMAGTLADEDFGRAGPAHRDGRAGD